MRASDNVKSNLFEWLAISRSELGFPPGQVRPAFEEAIRLNPTSERVRRNLQVFEEMAGQTQVVAPVWHNLDAGVVRAIGHAEHQRSLAA